MQQFAWYYCYKKDDVKDIIDNCIENHGNKLLKYRERRSNENNGQFIYQTKYTKVLFLQMILKIIVSDDLVYISDVNPKQQILILYAKERKTNSIR